MMIKKLEPEDILALKALDDHIEDILPGTKGEWVQWLMANVANPNVLIIGGAASYLVAVNAVHRPVSDHVLILFFYSGGDRVKYKEFKHAVDEWAREKGTRNVRFLCRDIKPFEKYGAEPVGIVGGWEAEWAA